MHMRYVSVVGILGLILVLLIAACGDSGSTGTAATPGVGQTRPAATAASRTPAPTATPAPQVGGQLRWWIRTDNAPHDPHRSRRSVTYSPAGVVFNNLIRPAMDNADALKPDLADSWEMSNAGQTYVFRLKKNVTWHDGQRFTAADVKYTLDKMVDAPRSSTDTRTFITGYKSSEVVDESTVRVELSYARASFLNSLTLGFMVVEPKHIADSGKEFAKTEFLVGTGPFKFKEAAAGVSWTVEKNPNYYHSGKPYLDGIQAFVISDPEAQIAAVATKRVDMGSPVASLLAPEDADKLQSRAPGVIVFPYATAWTRVLYFNLRSNQASKPWANARVRQALFYALDLDKIRQGTQGRFAGDASFSIPGSTLGPTKEELAQYLQTNKPHATRLAEAKQMLAAAGFPNGFDVRYTFGTACKDCIPQSEIIAEQWRQIGVRTTIVGLASADFAAAKQRFDFEVYQDSWGKFLGTLEETLGAFVKDAAANIAGYSNADVDRLYPELLKAQDVNEQKRLAKQIETILWRDLPFAPLFSEGEAATWWPWVHGYTHTRVDYFPHSLFDEVWLSARS